jgi:hypothetical protein
MTDLQKHLIPADSGANRLVGSDITVDRPAARYEEKARLFFQDERDAGPARPGRVMVQAPVKDLGEVVARVEGERRSFVLDSTRTTTPGVYRFDITRRAEAGGESKVESAAFAVNVDTDSESDLRRASLATLQKFGIVHEPNSGSLTGLVDVQRDLSESAWLYVLFLIVLVAEQALAVHLSFHLKGNETVAGVPVSQRIATA